MTNDPPDPAAPQDPAFLPTGRYDESALNRARSLLDAMPESVGPYRVLERLGGGGMGEVYRAEQRSPIRRDVALKFIKLGMDTKLVIARFEAERQALALMDHPHIAKVFDAGTDDTGRPYFVMEYVKGKPITEYADQNHLSISERLELFEQVCQAVQHAHHKGVIHRDLKPGNVLVSTQDGKPFAKVIDFGIAKAIAQRLTDQTLFTEHAQFVGTPQYMSPEQAEGSVDIDTRTDVYSLGVMLYELLTGSTPFSSQELKAAAFEQIKKLIVEVDPPKPSTRLSLSQPTLSTLAASRRTEPKRLGTLVRGELDWIVMKALDKDRKRRYETPTSLANDIEAHRTGEPVQAAPPSTAYRVRKFVRKHRGPVIGAATVGVALLLGIIGTTWGYFLAERTADREREAKDRERLAKEEATEQRDAAAQARDQAEGALARGFVRPLTQEPWLNELEIEPLWELATLESDTVGLRMLDLASRDPQMTSQLLRESTLVAAIGLSPGLRQRALGLLRPRVDDPNLALDHRAEIAWLALLLLDKPGRDSAACVEAIRDAAAGGNHSQTVAPFLYPIAPELAAELLLALIADPKLVPNERPAIASYLTTLSARVPRETAARIRETAPALLLTGLTDQKRSAFDRSRWADALAALSTNLEREAAERVCESAAAGLLPELANPERDSDVRSWLVKGLATLSTHLPPEAIARLWEPASAVLLADLANPNLNGGTFGRLARALDALSARLPAESAVRICESLWDNYFATIANPLEYDYYYHIFYPAELRAALWDRLPPDSAARICESVSERLLAALSDRELTHFHIADIAISLSAVTKHLEPAASTRICESASAKLLTIFADPERTYYGDLPSLAKSLAALAERLGPIAGSRICESASAKMLAFFADPERPYANLADLAASAVTLSSQMTPVVAARVCDSAATELLAKFANSKRQPDELLRLANELAALSAHLPPDAAARVCEPVSIRLLTALDDPASDFSAIAHALVSLSERMQPAGAKSTVLRAIRSLTRDEIISVWFGKKAFDLLESMAMASRHLDPPLRQTLVHHFLVLRFAERNWGSSLLQSTLGGLQRQEPHYAAIATPSGDTEHFTVPVDQEFLTLKLTTQEVVEFLKSPMKNDPERRAFLGLLECRYGRRFGNQWAFVEFAQAENLGLDFTTRVQRPDPKAILKTIHKLIDEELAKP